MAYAAQLVQRLERPAAFQACVDRGEKHHGNAEKNKVLDGL